jgi:hypothetical protein
VHSRAQGRASASVCARMRSCDIRHDCNVSSVAKPSSSPGTVRDHFVDFIVCLCGILQCKPKFEVKRRYLNEMCLGSPVQAVYRRASRDVLNVLNNQVSARSLT